MSGAHRLEVIDVDGRQRCTTCCSCDIEDLMKPCPGAPDLADAMPDFLRRTPEQKVQS